jgi:hypothetical protein
LPKTQNLYCGRLKSVDRQRQALSKFRARHYFGSSEQKKISRTHPETSAGKKSGVGTIREPLESATLDFDYEHLRLTLNVSIERDRPSGQATSEDCQYPSPSKWLSDGYWNSLCLPARVLRSLTDLR